MGGTCRCRQVVFRDPPPPRVRALPTSAASQPRPRQGNAPPHESPPPRTAHQTVQLGLIPVHVYYDIPWIPYEQFFEAEIGFVTSLDELPALLRRLKEMPDVRTTSSTANAYC